MQAPTIAPMPIEYAIKRSESSGTKLAAHAPTANASAQRAAARPLRHDGESSTPGRTTNTSATTKAEAIAAQENTELASTESVNRNS